MDFNTDSIVKSAQNFSDKSEIANISEINNSTQPDYFSSLVGNVLPENIINYDSKGIPNIGSAKNFNNNINLNIEKTKSYLNNVTETSLNNVIGKNKPNIGSTDPTYKGYSSLEMQLIQQSQNFSKLSNSQANFILNTISNSNDISIISNSMMSSIENINKLSPKQKRDLRYPDKFNITLNNTVSESIEKGKSESFKLSNNAVNNNTLINSGQNALKQYSSPIYSGDNTLGFRLKVRRTVYWAIGPNTDPDSANYISATGRRLQQGISAAVDNDPINGIPFLSVLIFDDIGTRYAVDTGGAVKGRVASNGLLPIVDIFFNTREEALKFASNTPEETFVTVYPPKTKYVYVKNSPPTYGMLV